MTHNAGVEPGVGGGGQLRVSVDPTDPGSGVEILKGDWQDGIWHLQRHAPSQHACHACSAGLRLVPGADGARGVVSSCTVVVPGLAPGSVRRTCKQGIMRAGY